MILVVLPAEGVNNVISSFHSTSVENRNNILNNKRLLSLLVQNNVFAQISE